ncbi:hypothetical protein [[Mycoplasma] anseris]|uniref:Uncharacterized protein n=1 Tax=[Mycoplasma] anseris TaxID=92400 RepID=A0A2Z4NCA5_9BACT|nr:hypothetical protein [[Mycoplasma] anseris]AWX69180.1 hypothetical protein DP065_00130 [[Mycoplasma] anseris]
MSLSKKLSIASLVFYSLSCIFQIIFISLIIKITLELIIESNSWPEAKDGLLNSFILYLWSFIFLFPSILFWIVCFVLNIIISLKTKSKTSVILIWIGTFLFFILTFIGLGLVCKENKDW